MQRLKLVLLPILFYIFLPEFGWATVADSLKYIKATEFELIGQGFSDTKNPFGRLPSGLNGKTRQPVWSLSKNCSGRPFGFVPTLR